MIQVLSEDGVMAVKLGLALLGGLLLAWGWVLERRGESDRHRRTRDAALAVIGALAFASWWNFGRFHFLDTHVHLWEHYHYYLGAKYAPELGYTRLYDCTAAADLGDGMTAAVEARTIRDLATNEIRSTSAIVADPSACTRHFSPERWEAFRRDVRFFRGWFTEGGWERVQRDQGYNPTPVWTFTGRLLAESLPLGEPSDSLNDSKLAWSADLDSLLLIAMWGCVWWAFGWRAMCVALIWWGTNFPARFFWNGGAMLRFDWLFTLVAGVCLLKRDRPVLAGFALAWSALLRVFPGFVLAVLAGWALSSMVRERRLRPSHFERRFALGCVAALALLLPAAAWATGSFFPAWGEFAANSAKQLRTPASNSLGLETLVDWDPDTYHARLRDPELIDPRRPWTEARRAVQDRRHSLYLALLGAYLVALAAGLRRERAPWAVACLGCGLIPMAASLPCYYVGYLLCFGLLWPRVPLAGGLTCAMAAATCAVWFVVSGDEAQYAWVSLAVTLGVATLTIERAMNESAS